MSRRKFPDRSARFAIVSLLVGGAAWGQPMYKTVTPDGKVIYTDKPPAAGQGSVQQMRRPQAGGAPTGVPAPAVAPMPGGQGVGIVLPGSPLQGEIRGGLLGSKEMNDFRDCNQANAATQSLIRAAEEVMRSVNNTRISGTKGASTYQNELLERQWKYYKSLGGTASSPEQVRLPQDPCKDAKEALQQKSAAMEATYRACTASHAKEMKLSALSKELVGNRQYLAMLEKVREEKRDNPKFDSSFKGSGEWAAAFKTDPALVRAALASKFQEYRSAGGPASRLEDVSETPNPCTPEISSPSRPSPVTAKQTLILPGQ